MLENPRLILILVATLIAILTVVVLIHTGKARKRKKIDKEQMFQYMREETLNQALSNPQHHASASTPERPMEIQYDTNPQKIPKGSKALRLVETQKDSTVTRQYLFRMNEKVFIGVQDGHNAIFHHRTAGMTMYCEFFSVEGEIYARNSGTTSRLIRGKKSTILVPSGIQLLSGDVIETPYGSYTAEIIQN